MGVVRSFSGVFVVSRVRSSRVSRSLVGSGRVLLLPGFEWAPVAGGRSFVPVPVSSFVPASRPGFALVGAPVVRCRLPLPVCCGALRSLVGSGGWVSPVAFRRWLRAFRASLSPAPAPASPFLPAPVSLFSWERSPVVVRSVPASVLRGCRPSALGGVRGLFGSPGLLGALCAPWPLSPVSRRVVGWAVSVLAGSPGVRAVFLSSVSPRALSWCCSVLASALGCPAPLSAPARVLAWCSRVSASFSPAPLSACSGCSSLPAGVFGGWAALVRVCGPVARAVWRVVLSACRFLASGGVPVGGLAPRRPCLARLLSLLLG